jgi:hypothetical protein
LRLEQALFAEDVRAEQNGLMTLVGCFPAGHLFVLDPDQVPLPKLGVLFVLGDMKGISTLRYQYEVTFGDDVLMRTDMQPSRREPEKPFHSLVMTFAPQPYRGLGVYRYKVTVEAGGVTQSFSKRLTVERSAEATAVRDGLS